MMQTYDQYLSTNPDDALDAEPAERPELTKCRCGALAMDGLGNCWSCNPEEKRS